LIVIFIKIRDPLPQWQSSTISVSHGWILRSKFVGLRKSPVLADPTRSQLFLFQTTKFVDSKLRNLHILIFSELSGHLRDVVFLAWKMHLPNQKFPEVRPLLQPLRLYGRHLNV
jgi:hypothetical protein